MAEPVDGELRFTVLGPVRAWRGERELRLGSPQQRAVLVALLLRGGRAVPPEDLVDAVWGEDPPPAAVSVLRTYASRLRRVLEPDRPADRPPRVLRSVAGGYALHLGEDALDARVRERQVARARQARADGEPREAAALLRAALADWESVALVGVPGPLAEAERARLAEARIAAVEARLAVDLELGRHNELVAELTALVAEYPLRERLCRYLMLALYRSGRQAEALAVFSDTRRTLVSELGVEPGHPLRDLHARVLAGDPGLAPAPEAVEPAAELTVRPEQLPSAVPDFVGREEEVEQLRAALGAPSDTPAAATAVVVGMGGVGKTTLAVRVAHALPDRFPEGRLYTDLRGADDSPADPHTVLAAFLRALGAPDGSVPGDPAERAAQYRSLLARRRVLVVLDNAHDTDQVTPLLPGSPSCAAIVTSRFRLAALPATRRIELAGFTPRQALDLFTRIAGDARAAAEPAAAMRVVRACGGLPLAVRVVASRLAVRPGWSVAALADRLADERQRLEQLRAESLAVESSFRLGYAQLDAEHAHAFRLLSLPEVPDISLDAAAAVLGLPRGTAERALEQLVDAGMLESPAADRYRYHDLLRLFARQRAEREGTSGELDAALGRLLDHCLATARTAYRLVRPAHSVPDALGRTAARGLPLADATAARAWADRELAGLLAVAVQAATGPPELTAVAADLVWALDPLLEERFGWHDAVPACRALARAARDAGDERAEARVRYMLAGALMQVGRWVEVEEHAREAIALARAAHDPTTVALTLNVSGVNASYRDDDSAALDYLEEAVAISRGLDDRGIEEYVLGNLIQSRIELGHRDASLLADARHHLALTERIGEPFTTARSLYRLGQVLRRLGRRHRAIATHRRGLDLLEPDGPLLLRSGHLFRLAEALRAVNRPQEAVGEAERALVMLREIRFGALEARTLRFIGDVLHDLRQVDRARACWREAYDLLIRLDLPTGDLPALLAGASRAAGDG
ncbi:BTAD domain-containing putative transcriptional regulator [Streptomyces sp. B6B3]|uniref:AfsR/SARP family transcriptional regulator n=1 Tax=Streptomyces sp. B6B3 TaxID=3153570 RepID=UPI00325D2B4B